MRHSLLYTPRPRCLLRAESREVGQEAEHRVSETQQVRMPIVRARPSVSTPRSPQDHFEPARDLPRGGIRVRARCIRGERGAPPSRHRRGRSAYVFALRRATR